MRYRHAWSIICVSLAAYSQDGPEAPAFEVVSIRQALNDPMKGITTRASGGPGSPDPTRFTGQNLTLSSLVTYAYAISYWQLSAPELNATREMFDISATIPEGATKEQFNLMMQRMLRERFGLKVHWDTKEMPQYELIVAKNGPKFKPSKGPEEQSDPGRAPTFSPMKLAADGYPDLPPGRSGSMFMGRKGRAQMINVPLSRVASFLSGQLKGPVEDKTGLEGNYDIAMYWDVGASSPLGITPPSRAGGTLDLSSDAVGGPTLLEALKDQLGLALEKKRAMVKVLTVDHFDKLPTAN